MKAWAGFDLEIFNTFEQGRPYGISCAAVHLSDTDEIKMWTGAKKNRPMNREECADLVAYLERIMLDTHYTLVSWNGAQFDFDVLAEESGLHERCAKLAMQHTDMMFHFFCIKGFPVKLDKVCQVMKVPGKLDGMSGAAAPQMWKDGKYEEVMRYLEQDCRMTSGVAAAATKAGSISWITVAGRTSAAVIGRGLLSVEDAMKLHEPDTSWMSKPIKRSQFLEWIDKEAETSVVYFTVGDEHAYDLIGVETVGGKMRLITCSGHSVVIGVNGDNVVLSYLNSEQPFATWSDPVPIGKVTDSAPF